jgi:hypothetical protein
MFRGGEGFEGKEQLQMRGSGRERGWVEKRISPLRCASVEMTGLRISPLRWASVEMTIDGGRTKPDGGLDDGWAVKKDLTADAGSRRVKEN